MKFDPNASRKAQRSAVASPYARTTQRKPQKEASGLPSSSSFSSIFSFITAPFRSKKVDDDEEARPPMWARDSEAEVAAILPAESDSEPGDEGMDVFGPSTMNPAERLAMRGHELARESVSPPVFERPILAAPRDDSRRTNRYVAKPDSLPPNSPPVPFSIGRSPTPLEDAQASIEQLQGSMRHDKMNVVSNFINQKLASNQPLSKIEAYGLRALIDESVDNGVKPLAATPSRSFGFNSPSTPIRSSQSDPVMANGDANSISQSFTLPSFTSAGTRISVPNKNPNPPLVYRGAGRSAHKVPRGTSPAASGSNGQSRPKPVRYRSNRFGTSGAGVPPVPAQPATEQQQAAPDTKRRRLDEDDDVSNSKNGLTKPATNGTSSNELATPARQRPLFGIGPATTNMPTKPSPLRQSMRPDSPGSPGSPPQISGKGQQRPSPQGSPLVREIMPTVVEESPVRSRSFDVLSQVIANNTPKKPDLPAVQNPYEASSPFRTTRRAAARKVAAPAKPAVPEKKPEPVVEKKELSVLELIEKTAPASMKKTPRPKSPSPPRLVPTPSPAPTPAPSFARSSFAPSPSINLAKAARANGFKPAMEDAMDESEDTSFKTNGGGSLFARIGAKTPEAVDEIIDLMDDEEEEAGDGEGEEEEDELEEEEVNGEEEAEEVVIDTSSANTFATAGDRAISPTLLRDPYRAKEPSPLRQSYQAKSDSPPDTPKARSPRVRATELEDAKLPTFTFAPPKAVTTELAFDVAVTQAAKYKAANAAVTALPTFTFGPGVASTSSAPISAFSIAPPSTSATAPAATTGFNWAAAGMKPPTPSTTKWTCGVCMVPNDAALAKCAACEEPRPASFGDTSAPKANGFDWAAAGIKPPAASTSKWDCPVCMIANDASLQKCAACEEPRPGAAPSAAPVAFNWGAAGFKPPAAATDEWTCGMCACKSPASAKECVVCETPK